MYSQLKNDTAANLLYRQLLERFKKENDSLGIRTALYLLIRYSNDNTQDYDRSRNYCFEELTYFRKGDATAARMEQHSLPGQINLSEKTYELVKGQFAFTYRGEIEAKNKGAMKMYFVLNLDQTD